MLVRENKSLMYRFYCIFCVKYCNFMLLIYNMCLLDCEYIWICLVMIFLKFFDYFYFEFIYLDD